MNRDTSASDASLAVANSRVNRNSLIHGLKMTDTADWSKPVDIAAIAAERQEERWRPLADSRIPDARRGAAIRSLDWFCALISSAGLGLKHKPPTRHTALTTALEQYQTFVHMHRSLVTQRVARTAKRPSWNATGDHTQNAKDEA